MSSLFLILCGLGGGGLLYFLSKRADKGYQWALAIALYAWICLGISFIYIAWGFVVARTLGFIGKKREA